MDIPALFETHIRNLRRSGTDDEYTGLCPFHEDKNPSFSVNLETGLWVCHAGCSQGDAATFAERVGEDKTRYYRNGSPPSYTIPTNQAAKDKELDKADKKRGLGFHKYLLANFKTLKASEKIPKCWTEEAVKETFTGYDENKMAITFIHANAQGKAVNLKWHKTAGGDQPKSINGHGQCRLYPLHLQKDYDTKFIIYCEGEKDLVTLRSHGFGAATGTTGAQGIPSDLRPLSRFNAVVVILDQGKAGLEGSVRVANAILAQCPETEVCISHWPGDSPEGYDITEFFQGGGTAKEFEERMLKEIPIFQPIKLEAPPQARAFPQFSPRLDLDRLTPALREFLRQAAPTSDSPDEFLIVAYLTYWAGVVGNKLLGPNGLRPNLWTVIFAGSSEIRKSTALGLAGGGAKVVQRRFDTGLKEAWAEYKVDLLRWESKPKKERAEAPEPEKPIVNSLLLPADFSDAGFYEALKRNPVSGIFVTTEFADFHQKLNRDYTAQADAFLSAYDNERMSRQTRSHDLETIEMPTFSILGATTFENFRKVFRASETENGFFQRIFPVAIPAPTKARKLYLQRSEVDSEFIQKEAGHIKAWLDCPGDVEIEIPHDTREVFSAWEAGFISGARGKYGERIGAHLERMVPGCLKLAMLCESLEVNDPEGQTTLTLSTDSLPCAQMLIENLFLPSVNYLLEEEIIYGRERMNEKDVGKALKKAGGSLDRTALIRETRLSSKELDEAICTLQDKGFLEVSSEHQERKQGGGNPRLIYTWIGE